MVLDFWFDVVCPFAYLASTRVRAIADEAGIEVRYRPILLGGVLKSAGADPFPMNQMPPARWRMTRWDMARQAAALGVPLHLPADHPRRTLDAMRVLASSPADAVPQLAERLFRAYWVEGVDLADRAALEAVLAQEGVEVTSLLADAGAKERLRAATDEAAAAGVFGVPTFGLGDRRWWGVDRLHFVREALGLPRAPTPPAAPAAPPMELFYDFASPFAYLGSTQADRVAREAGATLTCTPILLGALFRELGTPMVPLFTFSEGKRRYQHQDLHEWARWWGVPFRFPSTFPLRTVLPLRVALVEPGVREVVFRAAWAEDRDIGDPETLRSVLDDGGFDGAALLAGAEEATAKARLRENTDRARGLGVMGVPTFLIDGVPWWGQDRLPLVERALRGFSVAEPPG